jgi:hypothetical protein
VRVENVTVPHNPGATPDDSFPSAARALEIWLLGLPEWRPDLTSTPCRTCLLTPYRAALPDDVPLELLHRLVLLLDQEVRLGLETRMAALRAEFGLTAADDDPWGADFAADDDDLMEYTVPRRTLIEARDAWQEVLVTELDAQRPLVARGLDLYVRPAIDSWVEDVTALLPMDPGEAA